MNDARGDPVPALPLGEALAAAPTPALELHMSMERYIRLIAGSFILVSLLLAWLVSPYWLLFTAFVGLNLLQSALTRWCLMENILAKLGVPRCESLAAGDKVPR